MALAIYNASQKRENMLDPSHPAAHLPHRARMAVAPHFRSAHLDLRAYPKAFLSTPYDVPYPVPPYRYQPLYAPRREADARTAHMSVVTAMFNSFIHASKFVRYPVKRRLKAAVALIVTRGARVARVEEDADPNVERKVALAFEPADARAERWIKPGACRHCAASPDLT
jgi:hypothetical protein